MTTSIQAAYLKLYHHERYAVIRAYQEIQRELTEKKLTQIAGQPESRLCDQYRSNEGSQVYDGTEKPARRKVPKGTYEKVMDRLKQGTCKECKYWESYGGVSVCTHGKMRMHANADDTCSRWGGR